MKRTLLFSVILLVSAVIFAQDDKKEYELATIALYNVENLFDTIDQAVVVDEEYTPNADKLWNSEKYYDKISKLSDIISEIGSELTNEAPAVVGLCEVENKIALNDLVNSEKLKDYNYQIEHYDCRYYRGVDNALIYRPEYFKVTSSASYKVIFPDMPELTTRDQLVVSGELLGEPVHFIVLHYPSRRGGEKRSRSKRNYAASITMQIVDSLQAVDPDSKIILMGDLNDDPTNESVNVVLNATGKKNLKTDNLYNPMFDLYKMGVGSLAYRDSWNLFDQIIMTQSLLDKTHKSLSFYKAQIYNKSKLQNKEGRFKGYPHRSYVGNTYQGGYSDHFPAYIYLIREIRK